jgi:transcription elongation GreA/GreB family factor
MLYEVNQKDEQLERERKEKENALRRMREKDEQNEREMADLRNKLSRASLMKTPPPPPLPSPPQVNQNV